LVRSVVDALRVIRKAASVARVGQAVQAIGQVGQRAPVAPLAETANRLPRVFSEARIRSAWQVQIEARASARHYRLAHQALDSEACLVKYAVAHAAMRNRHPLAVYVMNACGVSDAVLAEPLAGAAKVAGFLEHLQESRPDLLNSLFSIGDMGLGPATLSPADMYRVLRAFCGDCRDGMDVGFNAVMAGMAAVDDAAGTANRVLRAVDVHDGGQPLTTLCDEAVEGIFAYGSAVEACRIGFATAGRAKDYVSVVAELMRLQGMKFNIKLWVIEAIREGTADAS
jgi:hypothetical protein